MAILILRSPLSHLHPSEMMLTFPFILTIWKALLPVLWFNWKKALVSGSGSKCHKNVVSLVGGGERELRKIKISAWGIIQDPNVVKQHGTKTVKCAMGANTCGIGVSWGFFFIYFVMKTSELELKSWQNPFQPASASVEQIDIPVWWPKTKMYQLV